MNALEHALDLARHHIPVFPCNPDKSPQTKRGFKDASTDERGVRKMFGSSPDALIGVPTGHRFDVLDVDLPPEDARLWVRKSGLPITRMHTTRRGGLHMLFRPDRLINCSQSKIADKVDTRGKGGYIIWWPAHGGTVEHEHDLAPWPDWILYLFPEERPDYPPRTREEDEIDRPAKRAPGPLRRMMAEARVDGILLAVAQARPGTRQATYFWAANRLREMADEGLVDAVEAYDHLFEAAEMSADPGSEAGIRHAIRVLR